MKRKLPLLLFTLSVLLLFVGLRMGEYKSVLEKAITVCLSCIGIG
jgi:hypothetical protein